MPMPEYNLRYGKETLYLKVSEPNLAGYVDVEEQAGDHNPQVMVKEALINPIGSPRLSEIVEQKGAKSALIIVNDITRPTPYQEILPSLINELSAAGISDQGITLLVATGIHRGHTDKENQQLYTNEICQRFKVINHDCDNDVVSIGNLADGTPLELNRLVKEHDLLITTGLIGLHYFAGYSGGRKSILPGIASRQLISNNHAMMVDERCRLDNIEDNPVNKIMLEAAGMAGVDFIINVVTDAHGKLVSVVAGELVKAWQQGVKVSRELSTVKIQEQADIVVASCGGFPKDINLYQAQKALDGAALAVKPGGYIILLAECSEGLGEETFARWIEESTSPEDIRRRIHTHFELGGHKAFAISRLTEKAHIILVSSLEEALVKKCYMQSAPDLENALKIAQQAMGEDARIMVMPHAANVAVRIG